MKIRHFKMTPPATARVCRGDVKKAFTLLEVVIGITVSSVLMLLAVSTIHQAFGLAGRIKRTSEDNQRIASLANQFRRDLATCRVAQLDSESSLRLVQDKNNLIQYLIEDKCTVYRENNSRGEITRELFRLPPEMSASMTLHSPGPFVEMKIVSQPPIKNQPSRLELRVRAVGGMGISGGENE